MSDPDRRPLRRRDDELLLAVDATFERMAAGMVRWPDPHPGMSSPADEEYSRCLDPGKYEILVPRWRAWSTALQERGLARLAPSPPQERGWLHPSRSAEDVVWAERLELVEGGHALLVAQVRVDGEPFGLDLGRQDAGRAPRTAGAVPFCGCDACDDGSDELLAELDRWVVGTAFGEVLEG